MHEIPYQDNGREKKKKTTGGGGGVVVAVGSICDGRE